MPDQLESAIELRLVDDDFKYLFIDEVQNVRGYEEVVNAFNADGGFPRSLEYDDIEAKTRYIEDVVGQIIEKDIQSRNKIRNGEAFERVITYVINNYGAPTSLTNLVDHLRNVEKIAVERRTVSAYIQMLVDAKILYRCQRFDLKSRKSLRGKVLPCRPRYLLRPERRCAPELRALSGERALCLSQAPRARPASDFRASNNQAWNRFSLSAAAIAASRASFLI